MKTKNRAIEKIKSLYPKTGLITVGYEGSGDQFNSFYDIQAYAIIKKNKALTEFKKSGRPASPEINKIESDVEDSDSFLSALIFDMFNKHSEVGFNNEGCSGTVTIDLENEKITLQNTYYVTESVDSEDFIYEDYPEDDNIVD